MKLATLLFATSGLLLLEDVPAGETARSRLKADQSEVIFSRAFYQAAVCTITAVEVSDEGINVSFTGKWTSVPDYAFSKSDRHGFVIDREKEISKAAWECLSRRFNACLGKPVALSIVATRGGCVRGGITFFSFPQDRFQITQSGSEEQ